MKETVYLLCPHETESMLSYYQRWSFTVKCGVFNFFLQLFRFSKYGVIHSVWWFQKRMNWKQMFQELSEKILERHHLMLYFNTFSLIMIGWLSLLMVRSVQSLSHVDSSQPRGPQHADLPVHHQLPEYTQTHLHWVGDAIQPSYALRCRLLLPSIFPNLRVFSNETALHIRWAKCWSFSFNISHSNEHSGLISFRMDWLDLLAVQGTLKSLLQHHTSKASILHHLAFFIVQLSHPYMTTGKTIPLTKMDLCWQSNIFVF